MSYTFTETETFTIDSTFDSLYADSLDDLESGTVVFEDSFTTDDKKQFIITHMNAQDLENTKNIIVDKDGTSCMYVQ